jgi:hypothetical protein
MAPAAGSSLFSGSVMGFSTAGSSSHDNGISISTDVFF